MNHITPVMERDVDPIPGDLSAVPDSVLQEEYEVLRERRNNLY